MKINLVFLIALGLGLTHATYLTSQTTTTYSVLSTAYNRNTGTFFSLGQTDPNWFLTGIQDMVVPLDPSTLVTYPNNPTYVVANAGNNSFPGIINNHSINHNTSTASMGQKVITYRTYFTLPNLNSGSYSYSLNFKMSADDAVDHVNLNGVKKGQYLDPQFNNIPGVDKPYLLVIPACDTSFRTGQNFIDITIADAGGTIGFYGEIFLLQSSLKCESVGIKEHAAKTYSFSVSPNPVSEKLTLHLNAGLTNAIQEPVELKLYSIDTG